MTERKLTEEERRLEASENRKEHWKRWGPYLSERAWGTVREDYSAEGKTLWNYFPHDHARSRSYRWNEDGIAGAFLRSSSKHLFRIVTLEWARCDSKGTHFRPLGQ